MIKRLWVTTATRTITLSNGSEYIIINAGNNAEGNYKNIVIGAGGGRVNLAAGYIVQNLDDVGQITATTEAFTKGGKGRLILGGAIADANRLGGMVNIDGGMLSMDRLAARSTTAGTRFAGIAVTGATVNINNGWHSGGGALIPFGSLALNNGPTLSFGGYANGSASAGLTASSEDAYFANGTTITGGKATLNTGIARTAARRHLSSRVVRSRITVLMSWPSALTLQPW